MAKYTEQILTSKLMESIQRKLQACLFMLCENALHLGNNEIWIIPYERPAGLTEIENHILQQIKDLEKNIVLDMDSRDKKIKEILALSNDIVQITESVYCYYAMNMQLQEILVHYQRLALIKEEKEVLLDIHGFYHDCIDFIEAQEGLRQKDNMAMLMKALPLKMAREKYYEYIRRGIDNLSEGANEGFIEDVIKSLKFKFMPCKMENYGKYYPEMKDKLETIFQLNFEALEMAELKELYQDLDETQVIFQDIMDYLTTLHECANFLILILTFAKDIEYLIEDSMEYKDIFYTCTENIFSAEAAYFDEKLIDMIDAANEALVDQIIEFENDEGLRVSPEEREELSEETRSILDIVQVITNGYYETLTDVIYPVRPWEEGNPASQEFTDQKKDELIQFIRLSLEGLKPGLQRIIKRLFLDSLPSPFSKAEFTDYVDYILETTNDFTQKLFLLDSVGAVFEMTGFADTLKQTGHEAHGHDHGHSHDHDHNCDCGHEDHHHAHGHHHHNHHDHDHDHH